MINGLVALYLYDAVYIILLLSSYILLHLDVMVNVTLLVMVVMPHNFKLLLLWFAQ